MEDFRIIYRILKYLQQSMDFEEFDCAGFTAERFGTNPNRFQALLIQLQKAGFIEGLNIVRYIRQPERIEPPMEPHITLQGLEYLQENSLMKKAAAFAKGVKEIVPGIFVVPMSVTFADGTTQLDDGTMTKDEFFARLAEDSKLPRTSQPSPASFMQVYEDAAAAGDEVLVITIGQKLSGTYQCAHLAAADVGLQVHIVDSEAASQAEALLVREAVRLRDEEGLTVEEIAAVLEQFKKRVRIVAVVDSLKHLQKGGRLPAAVAIVGGALGIKPVLALKDGEIKLVDKGRGRPGALVAMFKQLDALGGIDPRYGYTLLYSDNKQLIAPVHHYMHQNLQLTGGRVAQLGPTIGTHVGPGVVGVVFVAKE